MSQQNIIVRSQKISPCKLDTEHLESLFNLIQRYLDNAFNLEIEPMKGNNMLNYDFEETLKEGFQLNVLIKYKTKDGKEHTTNGDSTILSNKEVFHTNNELISLYINSSIFLKSHHYYPRNSIEIFIDFKRPNIFDFSLTPYEKTFNASNFSVSGADPIWSEGLYDKLINFFKTYKKRFYFIHGNGVYDIFLWTLVIPIIFWIINKLNPTISNLTSQWPAVPTSALYIYLFVISLFLFRTVFDYARWIKPPVEYVKNNTSRTSSQWIVIGAIGSIVGLFVIDMTKLIFNGIKTLFL
jgi:hypothetical protein